MLKGKRSLWGRLREIPRQLVRRGPGQGPESARPGAEATQQNLWASKASLYL